MILAQIPINRIRGGGLGYDSMTHYIAIWLSVLSAFILFSWPIALTFSLSYILWVFTPHGRWLSMGNNARGRIPGLFETSIEKIADVNGRNDLIAMILKNMIFPITFVILYIIIGFVVPVALSHLAIASLILFPFIQGVGYEIGWWIYFKNKIKDPIMLAEFIGGAAWALVFLGLFL